MINCCSTYHLATSTNPQENPRGIDSSRFVLSILLITLPFSCEKQEGERKDHSLADE